MKSITVERNQRILEEKGEVSFGFDYVGRVEVTVSSDDEKISLEMELSKA